MGFTIEDNSPSAFLPKPGSLTAIGIISICLSSFSIMYTAFGFGVMLIFGLPQNIYLIFENLSEQFEQIGLAKVFNTLNNLVNIQLITNFFSLIVSLTGIIGGIKVLSRKPAGRINLYLYAFGLILSSSIQLIICFFIMPEIFSIFDLIPSATYLFESIHNLLLIVCFITSFAFSITWPVIILIVLTRPKVKSYFAS